MPTDDSRASATPVKNFRAPTSTSSDTTLQPDKVSMNTRQARQHALTREAVHAGSPNTPLRVRKVQHQQEGDRREGRRR